MWLVFIVPNQAIFRVILGCLHRTLQCTMVDLHGQALKSGGFHPLLNITVLVSFILVTVVGSVIFSILHIGNRSRDRGKRTFQRWYKTFAVECSFPNPNPHRGQLSFQIVPTQGPSPCLQPRRDSTASIMSGCSHSFRKSCSLQKWLVRLPFHMEN